jgi:hypothetical protein
MKLNWNKNLFFFIRRRRKNRIIGHDIYSIYRSNGRFIILDGLCISLKGTKHCLLTSSISIRKKNSDLDIYYMTFPIYLTGALYFKIKGITYGYQINCSKLVSARLK